MKFGVFTLLLALVLATAPAASHAASPGPAAVRPRAPLPWIVDDWPRALSVARARKLPIFVENWAPW